MTRIVITGACRSGKTTLSASYECPVYHTDDLIESHDWSAASQEVSDTWLTRPGPWCIEGVTALRGLRKALERPGKPCDEVVYLSSPKVKNLSQGQISMNKGCEKIWKEILPELKKRGVEIVWK